MDDSEKRAQEIRDLKFSLIPIVLCMAVIVWAFIHYDPTTPYEIGLFLAVSAVPIYFAIKSVNVFRYEAFCPECNEGLRQLVDMVGIMKLSINYCPFCGVKIEEPIELSLKNKGKNREDYSQ